MSIYSMTGFGRTQGQAQGDGSILAWAWEARSVNGRGLDLRLRLPSGFDALDQPVRKLAGSLFARGNISINLQVERQRSDTRYQINQEWLAAVNQAALDIRLHGGGGEYGLIQPEALLGLRGVIEAMEDSGDMVVDEALQATLMQGAEQAFTALKAARETEGAALEGILTGHIDMVDSLAAAARATASTQPATLQARMLKAVSDLTSQSPALPEERIAQEVALLAAKADVREELDRLQAHIASGRELLADGKPCGRKLEFLAQEFHREANTLGSKSQDIEMTRIGLDLKATIDQVREQVANVE